MFKKIKNGFTLVELLVVIAILSILATVSVVGYTSFIEKSAISTDSQLVTQLNNFKTAYEIANSQNFTKDDISKMLKEAELNEITLQSEKYGYGIYYNTDSEKFELIKETEVNESIHVMINYTSNGDDTDNPNIDSPEQSENNGAGDNDQGTEGGNGSQGGDGSGDGGSSSEGNSGTGDNTGSDNDESDVIEPKPTIEFIINPNSLPQSTGTVYANYSSETNELNIGVSIEYTNNKEYVSTYIPIILSEFISVSNNAEIDFECTFIQGIDYNNYNVEPYTISNDASKELIIRKIGKYQLTYSVGDLSESMTVNVYNTKYSDASLIETGDTSFSSYYVRYAGVDNDGYIIRISPLYLLKYYDYMYGYEYETDFGKYEATVSNMSNSYIDSLIVNKRIEIIHNNEIKELTIKEGKYCFNIESLISGKNTFSITLKYQGYNGVWVQRNLEISVNVKKGSASINSVTILE